jgi:hypothetical protein
MHFRQGLAFVFRESWAFLRTGWWLAILAGIPFSLSEMVRWGEAAPEIERHFAVHVLTALLDTYLFLVVVRFVAAGLPLGSAMRVGSATVRHFAPYATVTIAFVAAQYYVFLIDESMRTYWLVTGAGALIGALLAPWGVAAATGTTGCGPRRSIHMAAPHLGWSLPLYAILIAFEFAGFLLVDLVRLPISDIVLAGTRFVEVGFGLQTLVLASMLVVANQVATIAIAKRAGLVTPFDDQVLRDTFS